MTAKGKSTAKAAAAVAEGTLTPRQKKRQDTIRLLKRNWVLYLFVLPAVAYVIIFNYIPMYGIQIAFKDYRAGLGIWGSPWAGLKWFNRFFSSPNCWTLIKNTLTISLYSLIAGFPFPIILALILNYTKSMKFKRFAQTITYMPYFISTVVLVGMISLFFSPSSGFINTIIKAFGGEAIYFLGDPKLFKHIYVWSGIWQGMGYSSIIYIAALSGVSPELHESARIDGANIVQRMWHIDIPTILPTVVILLVMNVGSIANVGYEKVYLMQNSLNLSTSEVISTYVYKVGLESAQFSFSTAIGLMTTVINFILLIIANTTANKLTGSGLW